MCGIIAGFKAQDKSKKETSKISKHIVQLYEDQFSRGQEGFGLIHWDEKSAAKVQRATEPVKFLLDTYMCNSPFMIAHHRAPTSTGNYMDQTHPMSVSIEKLKYDYLVVHNGIITNAKELKEVHKERHQYEYETAYVQESAQPGYNLPEKFNDSEALAVEVALLIEEKNTTMKDGVPAMEIAGSAAFIAVQLDKDTGKTVAVFVGRNLNSPLTFHKDAAKLLLASESLESEVPAFTLFKIDPSTNEMVSVSKFCQVPYVKPVVSDDPRWTAEKMDSKQSNDFRTKGTGAVVTTGDDIGFKPKSTIDKIFPPDVTTPSGRQITVSAPTVDHRDFDPTDDYTYPVGEKANTLIDLFMEDAQSIVEEFTEALNPFPEYVNPREFTDKIHERMNWLIKGLAEVREEQNDKEALHAKNTKTMRDMEMSSAVGNAS